MAGRRKKTADPGQLAWDFDLLGLEGDEPTGTSAASDVDEPTSTESVNGSELVDRSGETERRSDPVPVEAVRAPVTTIVLDSAGAARAVAEWKLPTPKPAEVGVTPRPERPAPLEPVRIVKDGPTVRGRARVELALEATRVLSTLKQEHRSPSEDERRLLARWPGWGATPEVFDESDPSYADARAELKEMWSDVEWGAARRTILNAHYTSRDYARAIWDAVVASGFREGLVLEPGSGSGNFIGTAPAGARMVGIELDPTTARVSQEVYPQARIINESFADTIVDGDGYDVAIGNVPFGDRALYDPTYNPDKFSMHNHFIVKSLAMTKPGGIVAVLTSRFTLDSRNDTARARMAELGDFIGAVRLPARAHDAVAGTDVVTDLVMFRRRLEGEEPKHQGTWLRSEMQEINGTAIHYSEYFREHPERVIGSVGVRSGRFGPELEVRAPDGGDAEIAERLRTIAVGLAEDARSRGLAFNTEGQRVARRERRGARHGAAGAVGSLSVAEDGTLVAQGVTGRAELNLPAKVAREVRVLLEVRDAAVELLDLEASTSHDSDVVREARVRLNETYDVYASAYGPINRVETRATGRFDEDGEEKMRRVYPRAIIEARRDPQFATLAALELYDEDSGRARKADIFSRRVIGAADERTAADSPEDALALSIDRLGRVDVPLVAELLSVDDERARALIEDLVFIDPDVTDRLVPAAEYLSGDVRARAKRIRMLVAERPELTRNLEALEKVIPAEVGPAEIDVRPNASWLPADVVVSWLETITKKPVKAERIAGDWKIQIRGKVDLAVQSMYSTDRSSVQVVLTRVLNGQELREWKEAEGPDGRTIRVVDPEGTEALAEKAGLVVDHFQDWLWGDAERADLLQERYNDLFNGIALRDYSGARMSLPGLAAGFTPRDHQVAAVARMIAEPSVGLFHEVGAGKTATMIMGLVEMRRLGMVSKPLVVVPNNMLEQFTREFKQLYPRANVLAAGGGDVAKAGDRDGRRVFVAQAAMGDWDAVVMTQGAFARVGLGRDTEATYIEQLKSDLTDTLEEMKGSELSNRTTKEIEKQIVSLEERLKQLLDVPRDDGITFEKSGIDYLCVDEAHGYKNLSVQSRVPDLNRPAGSKKATDLDMKLWYLREVKGRDRVVTLATATPIANSMIEMFVMQRYVRPDLLRNAEVYSADAWAAQFTEQVTAVEANHTGQYRVSTRTAKFRNLPELLRMWNTSADVKTAEDLNLPVPALASVNRDGVPSPEVVSVRPTEAQKELISQIVERAEAIKSGAVDPTEDNNLKLSSDGRTYALDARLADEALEPEPGEDTKVDIAARRIMRIYERTKDRRYVDGLGEAAERPGAVQIVFSDRGTPSDRWNAYTGLRDALEALGMEPGRVRFIHEAANDLEKARLFAACRDGRVSVIVGSTEKMGTGTNIQQRAIALHHLDCPWRPADVTQREGRIVRQLNQNPSVEILRYVTTGSFDSYMWGTVTRKAKFINQVNTGRLDVREVDDISETVMSYAEITAVAAGDMRILRKAQLESDVTKLRRSQRAHNRGLDATNARIGYAQDRLNTLVTQLDAAARHRSARVDTAGDRFTGKLVTRDNAEGSRFTDRAEMGVAIRRAINDVLSRTYLPPYGRATPVAGITPIVGQVPFNVLASRVPNDTTQVMMRFEMEQAPLLGFELTLAELADTDPSAFVGRLEYRVRNLDETMADWQDELHSLRGQVEELEALRRQPWAKQAEYDEKSAELATITEALAKEAGGPESNADQTASQGAARSKEPRRTAMPMHEGDEPSGPRVVPIR